MSRKESYQNYSKEWLIDHILEIEKLLDVDIQEFYDKIKHGDAEHREWLAKEFEAFFGTKITR